MKKMIPSNQRLCVFLLILFVIIPGFLFAQVVQQWVRTYNGAAGGNDRVAAMVTDHDGNMYVTGTSNGSTAIKGGYVTIKYNAAGELQWITKYNESRTGTDAAVGMAIDRWGNIYVTGWHLDEPGDGILATVKYNPAGEQQWVATYERNGISDEQASAIAVDSAGNVYIIAFSFTGASGYDYVTVKYNTEGVQQWEQVYDGAAHKGDLVSALVVDPVTLDVYVTGFETITNSDEDYATVKYSATGEQQWVQHYNGPESFFDLPRAMALDYLGNVYVTGISVGDHLNYATVCYSPKGEQQWVQLYPGPSSGWEEPTAMVVDPTGNVYVTGYNNNGEQLHDVVTIKYSAAGQLLWEQLYNGPGNSAEDPQVMTLDRAGNIYIAGAISNEAYDNDYFILKYNPEGVLQWTQRYTVSNPFSFAPALAVDPMNDVYIGGAVRQDPVNKWGSSDYVVVKYIQPPPLEVTARPDTTVYNGYGSNCVTLKAVAKGGLPPYTYGWTPGSNTEPGATSTVCPVATTTYTITVTDALHTTATAQVVVTVIDVHCGPGGKNVMICHKGEALCVAAEAVTAHLKHGDVLGPCLPSVVLKSRKEVEELPAGYRFALYPNPLQGQSTISYEIPADAQVSIKVYDLMGREVATVVSGRSVAGSHSITFNAANLSSGIYQCRMVVGAQVVKVVKMQVRR